MNHVDKFNQLIKKQNKSGSFLFFDPINITYFTNFSGANALLITEDGKRILFVSELNYEQAKAEVEGFTFELLRRGEETMEKIARQVPSKKIAVDSLPIEKWQKFSRVIGGEDKIEVINDTIQELRKIKDSQEIEFIREACKIADIGIQTAAEVVRPGLSEKQVAAEVEYAMRKAGSDGVAFETIVASGLHSTFPHGSSKEKTIRKGDFVIVDVGATTRFYRSDITRTFIAGQATEKQRKIYNTVKLAHQKALEAIRPKVLAKEVDFVGRKVIEEAGFGEFFVHNLGHGVGLEVHEHPILSSNSRDILEVGNVVTDEPGIYVPGFGGVRIEDTVLVTKDGAEKLTKAPYASLS